MDTTANPVRTPAIVRMLASAIGVVALERFNRAGYTTTSANDARWRVEVQKALQQSAPFFVGLLYTVTTPKERADNGADWWRELEARCAELPIGKPPEHYR